MLDIDLLLFLLSDDHPRVREHAVRLSEKWIASNPKLQRQLFALAAADRDAQVRFQVALSLGEWDSDRILKPLAAIALADADDHWTRMAIASAVPNRAGALLALVCRSTEHMPPGRLKLVEELATLVGSRRDPVEVVTRVAHATRAGVAARCS